MPFQHTVLLLPCHSLEDFPTHYEGDEAAGLLATWCCGWHPTILAHTRALPQWSRADDPPSEVSDKLIVIPSLSQAELPTGFVKRAREQGATVVVQGEFDDMVAAALAGLAEQAPEPEISDDQISNDQISDDTVQDFFALAYVYLQIELLTRQMRYACNLDEAAFAEMVIAAADAANSGDESGVFDQLSRAFDLIAEERDHYYSVEAYLFDLTLVAPTTIGPALREQVQSSVPTTLLLTGSTLEQIEQQDPSLLTEIQQAWEAGRLSVAGGDYHEDVRFPLMSHEAILRELRQGIAVFERLLGRRPRIYGRRTTGLTPILPQILTKLGFEGAFHFTLDEGQVPQSGQAKLRWEGLDGSALDVLGRPPMDANRPETFLAFAMKMGESMDMDFVATVAMAHWPGKTLRWHDALRRAARFGQSLGRFVTADQYFDESSAVGHNDRFEADRYTNRYLRQDIIRNTENPLSSIADCWRDQIRSEADAALWTAAESIAGKPLDRDSDGRSESSQGNDRQTNHRQTNHRQTNHGAAEALAAALSPAGDGVLVVNSQLTTSRIPLSVESLPAAPTAGGYVYAREEQGKRTVVDVPAVGFAWLKGGSGPTVANPKKSMFGRTKEPPIAEEDMLRNEFFELRIHPETGGIRSMMSFDSRTNLLTQQLGIRLGERPAGSGDRWQDPDERAVYSTMKADEIEVIDSTPVCGVIESRGRLLKPEGDVVANFRQRVTLWRGRRVADIDIELDLQEKLRADPWKSYVANRLAWGDEGATISRSVHEVEQTVDARRIIAPLYLQIDNGSHRVCLLPHGLPYHRVTGFRMLDTLLMVRGETRQRFQLQLGIDVPQPYFSAEQSLLPVNAIAGRAQPPSDHAWLFHVAARNVTATHWESIIEEDRVVGVACRLLETAGKACRVKVAATKNIISARAIDFLDRPLADCPLSDGKAVVELTPFEWSQVELRWG